MVFMYEAKLKIILEAKNNVAAERVLAHLGDFLNLRVERMGKYHKGGFEIVASISIASSIWSEAVYNIIQSAQQFGRSWVMTDEISERIDITSNEFSVPGIEFVNITLDKNN